MRSKLKLTSTKRLVQPLDIAAPSGYTWVLIPYTDLELSQRKDQTKQAHVQVISNTKLVEPNK